MTRNKLFICIVIFCAVLYAQNSSDRAIIFPDLDNHFTLVSDFHSHTAFSDGDVWPTIRVEEADRDQLDVLAITDHLYKDPNKNFHSKDIPNPDKNRSFEIARDHVKNDLILIHGVELSREVPLGHCNAIFVEDINKLFNEDETELFEAANKQNAFTFWNHPSRLCSDDGSR